MNITSRGARRASLALALGLTGLATCASAAWAAPSLSIGNGADGAGVSYYSDTDGTAPHIAVVRGGSGLIAAAGYAFTGARFAKIVLPSGPTLAAGDTGPLTHGSGTA